MARGTVSDACGYLLEEIARLQQVRGIASSATVALALVRTLGQRDIAPATMLVVAAAMVEHVRREGHEWIKGTSDYPSTDEDVDECRRDEIRRGLDEILDALEDVGLDVAEMLTDAAAAATATKDSDGQMPYVVEIIRTNAPGSEETN